MQGKLMGRTIAAVALALFAAGCSGSSDDVAVEANQAGEIVDTNEVMSVPEAADNMQMPEAAPETNTAAATPPEAPVPPDAQMLDDADATGMTARVSRDQAADNGAAITDGE